MSELLQKLGGQGDPQLSVCPHVDNIRASVPSKINLKNKQKTLMCSNHMHHIPVESSAAQSD